MRILHVIPGLTHERGGPSTVVEALTRHQAAAGHQVAVVTTEQGIGLGEAPIRIPADVQLRRLAIVGPNRLAYSPRFAVALGGALEDADIVHVHSIFTCPVHTTLLAALRLRLPVILRPCGQLHRYSLRKNRIVKRLYLATCGAMIRRACTAWHYTSREEARGSWPSDGSPHFVVSNGIEPAQFAIEPQDRGARLRRMAPGLDGAPYVLFLGRFHNKKRIDLLVESFLAGAPAHFHLLVAGPDEQNLWASINHRLKRNQANAARVHRVGLVTGLDKTALLAGATLFALPSEHENFGIAALESLMAGTPTLLSPHVDLNEAIVAEHLGISAPLDLASWKKSFATVLGDLSQLSDMRLRAPRWVAQQYSWETVAAQLFREYQRVIERLNGPLPRSHIADHSLADSVG